MLVAAGSATRSSAARRARGQRWRADPSAARSGMIRRQLVERLPHEAPLHVGRHRTGLLVERHDAAGVDPARSSDTSSYSGFRKCRPLESSFTSPNTTTCSAASGCRPGTPDSSRQRMAPLASPTTAWKICETAAARRRQVRALDLAKHRGLRARPQRRDRLHPAAVFVAERKTIEQIFDGDQARALQVGGLARTDAPQVLELGCEVSPQTPSIEPLSRGPAPLRSDGCWRGAETCRRGECR